MTTTQSRTRTTDSRFFGVAEGIVIDVDDPQQEGRIKVKFPWLDDVTVTDWCRVMQYFAGGGYGAFFIPEEDDEVLVAFVQGDMRIPIVIGGLYNGVDTPPAHHPRLRRIQSLNGHRISFIDATENNGSKGALVIEDAHGNVVTMSNGKIVLNSVGLLELEAPMITLKGPGYQRVVSPNNNPI